MNDPELHITVGIPACGKSWWVEAYMPNPSWRLFSTDQIRLELTGNMEDQSRNDEVFPMLHRRVWESLSAGLLTYVDATNLKPTSRAPFLEMALKLEIPAYAHRFVLSENYEECQRRNLARSRVVPEDIMRRFHADFMEHCGFTDLAQEGWVVFNQES